MSKPGRNDPCYCGSGKKYKQCHLRSDQEAEREERAHTEAARFLRLELPRFARQERFSDEFDRALPLYWNDYYKAENAGEMSQFEALRFLDWFVFDYRLEDGARVVDHFLEEQGDALQPEQRTLLENWQNAGPAGAYELTAYEGQTLQLRNLFDGDTLSVFEAGGRGNVEVGEVILARLVPVFDQLEFSTFAAYLPDNESEGLAEYIEAARADADGSVSTAEFLRTHNYLIIHHALQKAEESGRPPVARLDKHRSDPPIQPAGHDHDPERERVHRQRTYGSTKPHMAQTRRKAV